MNEMTDTVKDLFQEALKHHQAGHVKIAEQVYNDILRRQPNHEEAIHLLGLIGFQDGDYLKAITLITRAVEIDPRFVAAHYNLGRCYEQIAENEKAIHSYSKALSLKSDDADFYLGLGNAQVGLLRSKEALGNFERAIELNPKFAEAHSNRGNVLRELKRLDEALVSYDTAISLNPKFAEAHSNRGNVLTELKRLDEALMSHDSAISLKPNYAEAHSNRGNVLKELNRLDEALVSYDRAISLNPYYAEAHFNKSLCLLLRGEFSEGWKLYDERWKMKALTSKPLSTDRPSFNLEDHNRVLVWAEQGVGDEIMFASMLPEFRSFCAKLTVQVDARLIPLFSRSISQDVLFYPANSVIPQNVYDQHISIGSIGKYLRNDEASFSPSRFGYLKADSKRSDDIRKSLSINGRQRICGISWRSENEKAGINRSLSLNNFLQSLSMKDHNFVSLQYGDTHEEIRNAKVELGIEVISCSQVDNFNDLDGLACLIQACDVVVSIDNTTVHLAGALGKDVRILLNRVPDWRWQLDRDDSPWYASARLYRQDDDGDWANAFANIRTDLQIEM